MAYQNVGTPRFYVDALSYLDFIGIKADSYTGGADSKLLFNKRNPSKWDTITGTLSGSGYLEYIYNGVIPDELLYGNTFTAILGHNLASNDLGYAIKYAGGTASDYPTYKSIVNDVESFPAIIPYDGFSIATAYRPAYDIDEMRLQIATNNASIYGNEVTFKIGALWFGTYYDMPHSPDLKLKMSIEMDGVKNIKTKGGASLTDINYTKPQDWGDMGAWQLGGVSNLRNGRRSWDLSFSYLSDSDIMPALEIQEYDSDDGRLENTDFFSQVWNKTMGGHLPFIFQPDGENNNPDQFAICRFDQSSLQYEQVANGVYDVKLKIRESW